METIVLLSVVATLGLVVYLDLASVGLKSIYLRLQYHLADYYLRFRDWYNLFSALVQISFGRFVRYMYKTGYSLYLAGYALYSRLIKR